MTTLRTIALLAAILFAPVYAQDPKADFGSAFTAATNLTNYMNATAKYQTYAGDPNGHLAGSVGQSLAWDSSNLVLYACTATGSTSTTVWGKVPIGIPNVTNDAQTKAAVVPNTAPTTGQILVGNAGGTAYVPKTMSGDITIDNNGVASAASKLKVWSANFTLFDPVTGDSGRVQFRLPFAGTVTSVACSVKAATSATINLDERAVATPDTTGVAVLTSGLVCDTDSAVSTTFTNPTLAADVPVALTISAVSGTPDTLRVHLKGTID